MQKKRKIALIVLAVAAALFLVGSMARCAAKAAGSGEAGVQTRADQGVQDGGQGGDPQAGTVSETRQYGPKEQELLDYLSSSIWADPTGTFTAEFTGDSVTERSAAGDERQTAFTLESIEAKPNLTTAVIETAGRHVTLSLTLPLEGDATVSSQAFSLAPAYERVGSVRCEIETLDDQTVSLIDGEEKELDEALASFCETTLPTATTMAFTGLASIDAKANTVTIFFEPNAIEGIAVQVVYDKASRAFSCSTVSKASL